MCVYVCTSTILIIIITAVSGIRIYPVYSPMSNICKDHDQAV